MCREPGKARALARWHPLPTSPQQRGPRRPHPPGSEQQAGPAPAPASPAAPTGPESAGEPWSPAGARDREGTAWLWPGLGASAARHTAPQRGPGCRTQGRDPRTHTGARWPLPGPHRGFYRGAPRLESGVFRGSPLVRLGSTAQGGASARPVPHSDGRPLPSARVPAPPGGRGLCCPLPAAARSAGRPRVPRILRANLWAARPGRAGPRGSPAFAFCGILTRPHGPCMAHSTAAEAA